MIPPNLHPTINSLIETSIKQHKERSALSLAFKPGITYQQLGERIDRTAAFLKEDGMQKKDTVAILSENSPNWGIAYLAVIKCGAIAVPILPDFPKTDVSHILNDAKVKFIFSSKRQVNKVYELNSHKQQKIYLLDNSEEDGNSLNLTSFSDIQTQALPLAKKWHDKIIKMTVNHDDVAAIIYTSGTSGHSKAVMLTHQNICANVNSLNQIIDITPDWTFLSILPLSHTYEFTVGFILALINGARIIYAGKPPTPAIIEKICRTEHPSVMCIVPMVIEKIYKKRVLPTLNNNFLIKHAVKIPWLRQKIMAKIGAKLMNFFGSRLKLLAIGGAAINSDAEHFLQQAGLPYLVGYGLTETSPLLSGGPFNDRTIGLGSVGKPVPGVEIKIKNPDLKSGIGEICARGANVMKGYYQNPKATQTTIDQDGWLATGDLGFFDKKGNLHIQGRVKSVIVLAHGENIYPEAIEDKLNSFQHIIESLVKENNGRLEARVYLDYDLIAKETEASQEGQQHFIKKLLKKIHITVNNELPTYSKIHHFIEQTEPFIKTATHKIKRYLYE